MRHWSADDAVEGSNIFSTYSPRSSGWTTTVTGGSACASPIARGGGGGGGGSLRQRPVNVDPPRAAWGQQPMKQCGGSPGQSFCSASFPDTPHALPRLSMSAFAETSVHYHGVSSSAATHNCDNEEEEEEMPSVRLSRHIPRREGMDMTVSAYNLLESHHGSPMSIPKTAESPSLATAAVTPRQPLIGGSSFADSSVTSALTESQISDDSSYITSLYNDMLADKLISNPRTRDASREPHMQSRSRRDDSSRSPDNNGPPTQQRRGILGGEVLRFGGDCGGTSACSSADRRGNNNAASPLSAAAGGLTRTSRLTHYYHSSTRSTVASPSLGSQTSSAAATRVLSTNPERVLDAPDFPPNSSQLVDWGSNNKVIIGLKSSLYAWDAGTRQAQNMVELQGGVQLSGVLWLHKCACVALSVGDGTTAIYDCRSGEFLRTIRLPRGMEVTALSANGPILALSSNSPTGCTQAFDLRAKNALIATYEGHQGPVTSMQYCPSEPFYLATGGQDGHVRIWDARRSHSLRNGYDNVHQGAVSALHWNPDKRSRLFTGGSDGVLCHIDLRASARVLGDPRAVDEESAHTQHTSTALSVTRAVKTSSPITGLICHAGEVLTAHGGQGNLQLRRANTLHLHGVFSAPNSSAGLCCLSMAPDQQRVCAAQGDETLKIWRVFDAAPTQRCTAYSDPAVHSEEQLR